MSYVNNSTLEGPGAELNIFKLHTRAFEWHIALHRIVFSLWAVSVKSNFSVADLASKQSTQRAILLFCSNLSTRIWFLCASCNSPVGFGCMWALFVAPWCLCYRTSKSRLSDHGFQQTPDASRFAIALRFQLLKNENRNCAMLTRAD